MRALKKSNSTAKEIITVREEFIPYQTKTPDSKGRITLGGKLKKLIGKKVLVESYQVFLGKNGDILLRPMVTIPSSEAWVYRNPEVTGKIRKGLEEARQGKAERVDDLDSFLDNL
jgi:hypothetical protein